MTGNDLRDEDRTALAAASEPGTIRVSVHFHKGIYRYRQREGVCSRLDAALVGFRC